jgi:hypothetical protein
MSGNGPVYFPLRPVLPSLQTRTGEFTGVSWIAVTDGPFRWFKTSFTCFVAWMRESSSMAFFIARARWVVEAVGGSNSVIQE